MKKYYIIFIVLVIIMAIAFYLFKNNFKKEKISDEEIMHSNNIHLEYSISNMRNSNKYLFDISEEGEKFEVLSYKDEVIISEVMDSDDINYLKEALIEGHVNKWDGFNKSDKHVLDGEMFTLKVKINDVDIYATGSNSFPKGYREFYNKLNEIIKKYDIMN